MAEVYRAKTFGVEGFERLVAVKSIVPNMAEDQEFIRMFIDEARIASHLTHQNIVQIYELAKHEETFFISMEYIAGRDLRLLLDLFKRNRRRMDEPMACYIISKVCEALDYAHRKRDPTGKDLKLIHRDVSPQNVLLSFEGEVKLCDFGIAKAVVQSTRTQVGVLKGKFAYMSPEQVRGRPVDHRSDLFALGVIFYEMLTGERLFLGESDYETLQAVRATRLTRPSQHNPAISQELESIVLRMLAREPADRYQWASDIYEDLHAHLARSGTFFHAHHLRQFMQETFAREIGKEQAKLEEYLKLTRPTEQNATTDLGPPVSVSDYAPSEVVRVPPELSTEEGTSSGGFVPTQGALPTTHERLGSGAAIKLAEPPSLGETYPEESVQTNIQTEHSQPAVALRPSATNREEAIALDAEGTGPATVAEQAPFIADRPSVDLRPSVDASGEGDPLESRSAALGKLSEEDNETLDSDDDSTADIGEEAEDATREIEPSADFPRLAEVNRVSSRVEAAAPYEVVADPRQPSGAFEPTAAEEDVVLHAPELADPPLRGSSVPHTLGDSHVRFILAAGLLVLVGVAMTSIALLRAPEASLLVETTPTQRVEVWLDGKRVAEKTPFVREDLPLGSHQLELKAEGFLPYRQTFAINEARPHTLAVPLESSAAERKVPAPALGRTWALEVATDPAGAQVSIDGEKVGLSPLVHAGLAVDRAHAVRIERDGYIPHAQPLEAPESGARRTLRVKLEPASTSGFLRVTEPGLKVTVDGVELAQPSPIEKHELPAGRHQLELSGPAGKRALTLEVQPGQTVEAPTRGE